MIKVTQIYDTINTHTFHPVRCSRDVTMTDADIGPYDPARPNTKLQAVANYLKITKPPKHFPEYTRIASYDDGKSAHTVYTNIDFFDRNTLNEGPFNVDFLRIRKGAWAEFCDTRALFPVTDAKFSLPVAQAALQKLKNILKSVHVLAYWNTATVVGKTTTFGWPRALITYDNGRHLMITDGTSILHYEYTSDVTTAQDNIRLFVRNIVDKGQARSPVFSDTVVRILDEKPVTPQ